ncbi:MAG: peptidylprolyl isomerase [Cyanobacteriota bacterium]
MTALTPQPWALTAGAVAGTDVFTDLAFTSTGQLLVAGGGAFDGVSDGGTDLHLSLRDLRGRLIWQWNYGTAVDDALLAVAPFNAPAFNGYPFAVAAGYLGSTAVGRDALWALFDAQTGDLFLPFSLGSNSGRDDQFSDVAIQAASGTTSAGKFRIATVVAVGVSQGPGSIGGQVKANVDSAVADGLLSIATVLFDNEKKAFELDATSITRLIGGSGDDGLEAVAVVPSGAAAGRILVGGHQTITTSGDQQAYLAAYDGSGSRLWEQFLGNATSAERLTAVVCDATRIYVAGTTRGLFPGAASQRVSSRTDADAFIAAFDLTGQPLWANQLDDSLLNEPTVQLALSGNRLELLTGDGTDLRRVSFSTAGQRLSSELIGGSSQGVETPEAIATDAQGRVVVAGSTTGAWPDRSAGGAADGLLLLSGPGLNAYQREVQPLNAQGLAQTTAFTLDPGTGLTFAAGSYAMLTGRLTIDGLGHAVYTPYDELPELYSWNSNLQDSIQLSLSDLSGQPAGSQELVLRLPPAPATAPVQSHTLNTNAASGQVRPLGLARPELLFNLSDTTYTTSLGASRNLSAFPGTTAAASVRLAADKAPITALNALRYARELLYNRTVFHRVIDGFMVQGGGFSADKPSASGFGAITSFPQIPLEGTLSTGLANQRGTIAMARTSDPNSASNQFFVNVVDNAFLNDTPPAGSDFSGTPGYAVFGAVATGMEAFDAIARAPLRNAAAGGNDSGWGAQNSGALFEDITEPVVVIEQAGFRATPAQLQYTLQTLPTNGDVSLDASTGAFLYRPAASYTGADSFEVRITSAALPGLPERSVLQRVAVSGTDGRASHTLQTRAEGNKLLIAEGAAVFNLVTSTGSPDLIAVSSAVSLTLRARSTEVWGESYIARNVGKADAPGTGQRISLKGLAKYSFVADAIAAANMTIELEPEKDSALFLHDAYSAFQADVARVSDSEQRASAPRLLEVDTIRMGSAGGTSLVDLTSSDYITGAVTVHTASRGRSIVWCSAADDRVRSGGGDTLIHGGNGNNQLELGAGVDTLQYRAGMSAQDGVTGFEPGRDRLELWAASDQAIGAPILTASATASRLSWGGNSIDFLGLPNLQLQQLQISYATATA